MRDGSSKRAGSAARNRRRGLWALGLVLAALVAAASAFLATRPRPAAEVADPLTGLDAEQALSTGKLLGRQGQASASLPYFRRAIGLVPDRWELRRDYAAALFDAVSEARPSLRVAQSVTRSSWERAAMLHEGLAQLDRAERLAPTAADRAQVIAFRGLAVANWGLNWNGLEEYGRAGQLAPGWTELHKHGAELARVMREPQSAAP